MNTVYYICGPTSTGKTALSVALAQKVPNAVFINADTMQMYKGLGVLAASPTADELSRIDHRLFEVLDTSQECSRSQWFAMAMQEIKQAFEAGKQPILVGGSRSFLAVLAQAAYGLKMTVDQNNAITFPEEAPDKSGFPYKLVPIILMPPWKLVVDRIQRALHLHSWEALQAATQICRSNPDLSKPAFWTFGFKELKPVVDGVKTLPQAITQLTETSINYAKEQVKLFNALHQAVKKQGSLKLRTLNRQKQVEQILGFMKQQTSTPPAHNK